MTGDPVWPAHVYLVSTYSPMASRPLSVTGGVELVWGGGEPVDSGTPGSFGYYRQGKFKPLFVVNDLKSEKTLVREPVVTIEVDLDSTTVGDVKKRIEKGLR